MKTMYPLFVAVSSIIVASSFVVGFAPYSYCCTSHRRCSNERCPSKAGALFLSSNNDSDEEEEWSDFDGYIGGGRLGSDSSASGSTSERSDNFLDKETDADNSEYDKVDFTKLFQDRIGFLDLTGCQTRQFSLGQDIVLSDYVGNMGFDEVTDWEYYYQAENDPDERQVVQPNPFDSSL